MRAKLQELINQVQHLALQEQLQLLGTLSESIQANYKKTFQAQEFWQSKTLQELVRQQNPSKVSSVRELAVDFWPEEDTTELFLDYLQKQRQEDKEKLT